MSGREQNETAGGNKMRLSLPLFSSPAGRATNPRCSRQNAGSSAVCWRGRASGGNGLPSLARVAAGHHRVTDSLRPRQQARPGLCIRTWINELAPRIQTTEPSLILNSRRHSNVRLLILWRFGVMLGASCNSKTTLVYDEHVQIFAARCGFYARG
jgi:hypothetical protein